MMKDVSMIDLVFGDNLIVVRII